MTHPLHGLTWEERYRDARTWTCRFRTRGAPEGSVFVAIAGGLVLLFLGAYGPACRDGGVLPAIAVLIMALPIFLAGYCDLRAEIDALAFHHLQLDRDRLEHTFRDESPEIAATAEIADFVEHPWCVEVIDREGRCLLRLCTPSTRLVAARLRAALTHVRELRTYRG